MGNNYSGCKNCDKRYVGCHSNCETYARFRERVDRANEARQKDMEGRVYHSQSLQRFVKEMRKRRRV